MYSGHPIAVPRRKAPVRPFDP